MLDVRNLTVGFGDANALEAVSFCARAGEVIGLVGDNGAGKSTLAKIISGAIRPAAGMITMGGQALVAQPAMARRAGIETVFQEPALCPNLTIAENLALGLEPRRRVAWVLPMFDGKTADNAARDRLKALGATLDGSGRPVRLLSGGERQLVQILRVMRSDVRLVILDEATAALSVNQAAGVARLARRTARAGHPVIVITHDVEEVFEVADRVIVLQRGTLIFDGPIAQVGRLELLRLMSGRNRVEATRTLAAVSAERERIERDVHDGAQQQLVNAARILQLATDQLRHSSYESVTQLLTTGIETIRSALTELRDLSRGIYPVVLKDFGLVAAVDSLARCSAVPVEMNAGAVPRVDKQVELAAYFVVAEALNNTFKHAQATWVEIDITHDGNWLHLRIEDDGVGTADERGGTGLRGLRERVGAVGGQLTVLSPPGEGTSVVAAFPVAASAR